MVVAKLVSLKNFGMAKRKIRLAPSLRYPKKSKLNFQNKVFLPYNIPNETVVIDEFKKIILEIT